MIVLGDRGDPANLADNHRAGELTARTRRPTTEFVLSGQWGETSTFLQVYLLGLFSIDGSIDVAHLCCLCAKRCKLQQRFADIVKYSLIL